MEECDIFAYYPEKLPRVIKDIIEKRDDICLIYSTSRPSPDDALTPEVLKMADVKVIFELADEEDLHYILGDKAKYMPKKWEKIVAYDDKEILLRPFTNSQAKELDNFRLTYTE